MWLQHVCCCKGGRPWNRERSDKCTPLPCGADLRKRNTGSQLLGEQHSLTCLHLSAHIEKRAPRVEGSENDSLASPKGCTSPVRAQQTQHPGVRQLPAGLAAGAQRLALRVHVCQVPSVCLPTKPASCEAAPTGSGMQHVLANPPGLHAGRGTMASCGMTPGSGSGGGPTYDSGGQARLACCDTGGGGWLLDAALAAGGAGESILTWCCARMGRSRCKQLFCCLLARPTGSPLLPAAKPH